MGLTRVARRAGTRQAATETSRRTAPDTAKASGSRGLTWKSRLSRYRPMATAKGPPAAIRRAPASCPGAAPCRGHRGAARRAPFEGRAGSSPGFGDHGSGTVDAEDQGAGVGDLRGEMSGATAYIKDVFAGLRSEVPGRGRIPIQRSARHRRTGHSNRAASSDCTNGQCPALALCKQLLMRPQKPDILVSFEG